MGVSQPAERPRTGPVIQRSGVRRRHDRHQGRADAVADRYHRRRLDMVADVAGLPPVRHADAGAVPGRRRRRRGTVDLRLRGLPGARLAERRAAARGHRRVGGAHHSALRHDQRRAEDGQSRGRGCLVLRGAYRLSTPAFDVVIAGAGPAGCAAAIALARHAPEWHVCLAAPPRPSAPRLGETLPPPARTLLAHLGVWDRFRADGHDPAYRTLAAWGSPVLSGNEFLLHAHQIGWRLDRVRFDRMMRDAAAESAAVLSSGVEAATWDGSRWTLRIAGATVHARMLIDATGRAARLARHPPSRLAQADRLVGSFVTLPDGGAMRDTLIEAVPDGWWFATRLPDGRRVLGCMTDADILRRSRLGSAEGWRTALAATRF